MVRTEIQVGFMGIGLVGIIAQLLLQNYGRNMWSAMPTIFIVAGFLGWVINQR